MIITTAITAPKVYAFIFESAFAVLVGVDVVELVGLGVGVTWGVGVGVGVACGGVGVGVGVAVGGGVGVAGKAQFQVKAEGAEIVKEVADVPPEDGTLPVPDQPEQVYPEAGEDTNAVMLVPSSNQPLDGEGES